MERAGGQAGHPALEQERRHALVLLAAVDRGEDQEMVGDVRQRDPDLLAVEPVASPSRRAVVWRFAGVRPDARLGQPEGGQLLARACGTSQRWRCSSVPRPVDEKLATFGLSEPGVGTDAGNLRRPLAATATRTASTARRSGSRWPTSPTISSSSRRSIGQEAQGRDGVPARARDGRPHDRHAPRQARDPAGNTGLINLDDVVGPGRAPDRRGGRGLPGRDERDRPGPVHGRGRRGRASPGVPRRVASATPTSGRRSGRRSASTSSSSR